MTAAAARLFTGEPPLIGRADELAMATEGARRWGCVIVGAPGVGKSRLGSEAARLVAGSGPVERVVATEPARRLPATHPPRVTMPL